MAGVAAPFRLLMSVPAEGALALLLLAALLAPPFALAWWSARLLLAWRGWWRAAAVLPLLPLVLVINRLVEGAAHDPMGHSGWYFLAPAAGLLGLGLARLLAALHDRLPKGQTG